jgi:hypothetical protein
MIINEILFGKHYEFHRPTLEVPPDGKLMIRILQWNPSSVAMVYVQNDSTLNKNSQFAYQ